LERALQEERVAYAKQKAAECVLASLRTQQSIPRVQLERAEGSSKLWESLFLLTPLNAFCCRQSANSDGGTHSGANGTGTR
jgi:hypothetical protein